MLTRPLFVLSCALMVMTFAAVAAAEAPNPVAPAPAKPSPDAVVKMLQAGNARFVSGRSIHPHLDINRLKQAGTESQNAHAYATVITCSDSRVPVELVFDAGVMDIFVIRVAGNVCDTDEIGSIEYGLAHVRTPVLVVLGHTQCGAVTAVTHAIHGRGHALERNIPQLVDNIQPAVVKAIYEHPDAHGDAVIPFAIEQNVWQGITDLLRESPSTRELIKAGKVKVVGAVYNVGTGQIEWLEQTKVGELLAQVEAMPDKATNVYAGQETDAPHAPPATPVAGHPAPQATPAPDKPYRHAKTSHTSHTTSVSSAPVHH